METPSDNENVAEYRLCLEQQRGAHWAVSILLLGVGYLMWSYGFGDLIEGSHFKHRILGPVVVGGFVLFAGIAAIYLLVSVVRASATLELIVSKDSLTLGKLIPLTELYTSQSFSIPLSAVHIKPVENALKTVGYELRSPQRRIAFLRLTSDVKAGSVDDFLQIARQRGAL